MSTRGLSRLAIERSLKTEFFSFGGRKKPIADGLHRSGPSPELKAIVYFPSAGESGLKEDHAPLK